MAHYAGKKRQNGKNFVPPRTVISLAWWWAKKNLHFVHSGQSYGGSKFNVLKNDAKVPNLNADLGLGSHFGPLCRQKRSKSQTFFPPEPWLRWLDDGPQKIATLAILAKVISRYSCPKKCQNAEVFGQVCTQWVIFFWHFSLLGPARATRGREIKYQLLLRISPSSFGTDLLIRRVDGRLGGRVVLVLRAKAVKRVKVKSILKKAASVCESYQFISSLH